MNLDNVDLLTGLLSQVSRSFYTTLRVLPAAVRSQIALAYLLARATDTIADTEVIPAEQRLDVLKHFRERLRGLHQKPLDLGELSQHQGSAPEMALLRRVEEALSLLRRFPTADQSLICDVLQTIVSGQELDIRRFAQASVDNIILLGTDPELDDYTYRVAGCVGEFWTRLCRAHLFPRAVLDDAQLVADGIRFGKGLQLVNILRDLPSDLRQGRCYIPADRLHAHKLKPVDLLVPEVEPRFRPLCQVYLDRATEHLSAGWDYTNTLPWSCIRLRLACAWPILIGARTLARLRTENVLDSSRRIKVTRREVQDILRQTVLLYPFPDRWRRLLARVNPL
jgi:farnesyl-diphosphate farnesyltransferase